VTGDGTIAGARKQDSAKQDDPSMMLQEDAGA
jgi:hypothetical protein